jgi:hypothetical protein
MIQRRYFIDCKKKLKQLLNRFSIILFLFLYDVLLKNEQAILEGLDDTKIA